MKLYEVIRTDPWGWDEYDSFVVRAENKENALKVIDQYDFRVDNTNIIEITLDGEEKIILGSFNAG